VSDRYVALVNPAAGGGRCGKQAQRWLRSLTDRGIAIDVQWADRPGAITRLARQRYAQGNRRFIAVGGDGTSFEIVNGLFPEALEGPRATLAFLPLGTGNSFLRDFTDRGTEGAGEAIVQGQSRACDVIRLTHDAGVVYYINLLSIGFAADVAAVTNRWFKRMGPAGYLLGVLVCLVRLRRYCIPIRADDDLDYDRRACLFLSINNSKYTGGTMLIAPQADPCDGKAEFVRFDPVARFNLLRHLRGLYDGSRMRHPAASRRAVDRLKFALEAPETLMIDGEVRTLRCTNLEVLPSALDVIV